MNLLSFAPLSRLLRKFVVLSKFTDFTFVKTVEVVGVDMNLSTPTVFRRGEVCTLFKRDFFFGIGEGDSRACLDLLATASNSQPLSA